MTANSTKLSISYSLADQDFATTKSVGIYNLSLGLLKALAADDRVGHMSVFTNPSLDLNRLLGRLPNRSIEAISYPAGRSRLARALWDQIGAYRAARSARNEWMFLPKGYASFLLKPPVRLVTYVHDAMHDHYRKQHPGFVPAFEMAYFWRSFLSTLRTSDVVVTNSRFTAGELRRVCGEQGVPEPLIVPVGIGFNKPLSSSTEKQNRLVVLSARWPHKLTHLAVDYLDRWQREHKFAGRVEWVGSFPEGCAFPPHSNWISHSRLTDDAYARLIDGSKVLVYFSKYEGFGMPPVEALIRGVAPVYSGIPACTEVMNGSGWAFANDDYDSFAGALNRAVVAPASLLEQQAETMLEMHAWNRVALRFIEALDAAN